MSPETSRHSYSYAWRDQFPTAVRVLRGEGGAVYVAEGTDGKSLLVIKDEGTMADFLPPEDAGGLVSLTRYSARERARCVADLVQMRLRHVGVPASREASHLPGRLDSMLVALVDETTARLESLARERHVSAVNERDHLQPCCARAARSLAPGWGAPMVSTQMQVEFTAWPRLGNVDVALKWPREPPALLELKCGTGLNALGQCVWDAAKLAFAMQCRKGSAAFLLAAAPVSDWERPIRGAEFFADGAHDVAVLRVLYADWWREWEKRRDPQPSELPSAWHTERVHSAPFAIAGRPWELRLAQVVVTGDDRLTWAPLSAAGH